MQQQPPSPFNDEDDLLSPPPLARPSRKIWPWGNPFGFLKRLRWPTIRRRTAQAPRPPIGLPPVAKPRFDWAWLAFSFLPRLALALVGVVALTTLPELKGYPWWSPDFWTSVVMVTLVVTAIGFTLPMFHRNRWFKRLGTLIALQGLTVVLFSLIGWPLGRNTNLAFNLLPLVLSPILVRWALAAGYDIRVRPRYYWAGIFKFLAITVLAWSLIFVPGLISLQGIHLPFGLPTIGQNVVQTQTQSQQTPGSSNVPNGTSQPAGGQEVSDLASALQGAHNYAMGHGFGKCSNRGLSGVVGFYLYTHGISDDEMRSDAMKQAFSHAGLNYRVAYSAYYAYAGLGGEFADKTYSSFNHCING